MTASTIPVDAVSAYYSFETRLDDNSYRFTLRWNQTSETWHADIEGLTNDVKLLGLPLIVGGDLLAPYAILELGSLYVYDAESKEENPTRESLGDRHQIIHITRGESVSDALAALEELG